MKKKTVRLKYRSELAQSRPVYLCVVGANWAGASERAVGVALLRVGEGVVLHFIIPGLHVKGGWPIPVDARTSRMTCYGENALCRNQPNNERVNSVNVEPLN